MHDHRVENKPFAIGIAAGPRGRVDVFVAEITSHKDMGARASVGAIRRNDRDPARANPTAPETPRAVIRNCADNGGLVYASRRYPRVSVEPGVVTATGYVIDKCDVVERGAGFGSRRKARGVPGTALRRGEPFDGPVRCIDAEGLVLSAIDRATRDIGTGAEHRREIDAAFAVNSSGRRRAFGNRAPSVRAELPGVGSRGSDDHVAALHRVVRSSPGRIRRGPCICVIAGGRYVVRMKGREGDRGLTKATADRRYCE